MQPFALRVHADDTRTQYQLHIRVPKHDFDKMINEEKQANGETSGLKFYTYKPSIFLLDSRLYLSNPPK